jgi:phytoene dehydrogenase-like protein
MLSDYLSIGERMELATIFGGVVKMDFDSLMSISFADWLTSHVKGVRSRQTLEAYVRLSTYGNAPDRMSAGAAFHQLYRGLDGVLYLDHGWNSMVENLLGAMPAHVTFRYGAHIESVRDLPEDAVLLCVPPVEANRMTGAAAIPDATLQTFVSSYAACLDICLKQLPVKENTFALGIDEPLYYSVHSNAAKLAPQDGGMIHLAYYLPEGNTLDQHAIESRLLALLDQLQPGWREQLVYKRFLPHMLVSFGMPTAELGGYSGLKSPRVEGLENVFIAGDFVGNGAQLVDCAVKRALEAVDMIKASAATPAARV